MKKSTINYKGVDYIVRTLDIRSIIPAWEDECYAEVQVADISLNMAFEEGDKRADAIDESIFFYLFKSQLEKMSDKKLVELLAEYL